MLWPPFCFVNAPCDIVPIFPMSESSSTPSDDDDVVDGPRRFHFRLDDSQTEAYAQHENTTDYLLSPAQAKAKAEKEPRRER